MFGLFLCLLRSFFRFSLLFLFLQVLLFLSSFFLHSSCSSCFLLSFCSIWASEDALVSNLARGNASSTLAGVDVSGCTNRSARVVEGSGVDLVVVVGATR